MPGVVIFTARCDRCKTAARWTQRENGTGARPDDLTVLCPTCDPKPVAA